MLPFGRSPKKIPIRSVEIANFTEEMLFRTAHQVLEALIFQLIQQILRRIAAVKQQQLLIRAYFLKLLQMLRSMLTLTCVKTIDGHVNKDVIHHIVKARAERLYHAAGAFLRTIHRQKFRSFRKVVACAVDGAYPITFVGFVLCIGVKFLHCHAKELFDCFRFYAFSAFGECLLAVFQLCGSHIRAEGIQHNLQTLFACLKEQQHVFFET